MNPPVKVLKSLYGIYQVDYDARAEAPFTGDGFFSLTKDNDEVTVICTQQNDVGRGVIKSELNWKILKVTGPLDFNVTGIIAGITSVLSDNVIPVFVVSTYSTDIIMVREQHIEKAANGLREAGYSVTFEE
jgi:hypothetical protein